MKIPVRQKTTERKKTEKKSHFLPFKKLDRAAEIAYYYGFMPIRPPSVTKDDVAKARRVTESEAHKKNYCESEEKKLQILPEEKIALLRQCEEWRMLTMSQTQMLYFEGAPSPVNQKKAPRGILRRINLDILGTGKSVAEAELIKAAIEILHDKGFEDLYVDINSIGDKDSIAQFNRELGQFYRKHSSELPNHCRNEVKKDFFYALECTHEKCLEISERAPKSISFLTETSRLHFKEVLEYLESMHIPYKIDNHLVGDRRTCCHSIFLIKTLHASDKADIPEETLAMGYRYNALAKKADMKRDIPAIGVTITFKEKHRAHKRSREVKKPQVYFIQIGFGAKLKSLEVIEGLRQAKIPLYQALAKDKLSSQIQTAENMGIPHIIIMGQKEANENSVIVRDMKTRFQENISISELPNYLKKLR